MNLPVKLSLSILIASILGNVLSSSFISFFYTISSCFIELLLFVLPVMVFTFIFRALLSMKERSVSLLALLFCGVTLSNCLALLFAYGTSFFVLPLLGITPSADIARALVSEISPLVTLNLPQLIGMEKALFTGILCGLIANMKVSSGKIRPIASSIADRLSRYISYFLDTIFIPFLPLYVFSFCLKLVYDGALFTLFEQYGKVFIYSMIALLVYIGGLYIIGASGSVRLALDRVKSMLPAGITGFSTMSSAATLPVTLSCVEKNSKDTQFTSLVIPTTANIHMLGDDITIMITSMTLLSVFGMPWPDIAAFFPFALAFSLAKLSCVGIPGASVLVILPVLQAYLGFSPEMISILTTIYVLQDPFGTAANVMGNGAFALILQRLRNRQARPIKNN